MTAFALAALLMVAGVSAWASVTVSLTAPANGTVYAPASDITLTADASAGQGYTLSKVEFFHGTTLIGTDFTAPYSVTWTGAPVGQYSLTAKATAIKKNRPDQTATSAAVNVTVIAQLYFLHADHLNTPRLVADATGTTVWRWDQAEPLGNNPADEDPDANSVAFDLPLRLPGQRYDAETGLHYNFYRDYDPSLGIYKQSDPIGLSAGLNTYAYVKASPLRFRDFFGLETCGSDGNEPFVPDNPLLFPFSECCRAHDGCYEDCTRRLSKGRCDNDFQSCTMQTCQRRWAGAKFACELLAVTYYAFVNSKGASAFEEARKKCTNPPCDSQGSK